MTLKPCGAFVFYGTREEKEDSREELLMGGFFGVASKNDCVFDLFFGTDYHSHLGTRRAGMAVYNKETGFERAIHNIENAPFRTKFDKDVNEMQGTLGIGCISDYEPQPLLVRSHHGTYAIMTVGKINNMEAIVDDLFSSGHSHFLEMSGGEIGRAGISMQPSLWQPSSIRRTI